MKIIIFVCAVYFFMENFLLECAVDRTLKKEQNEHQYDPLAIALYRTDDDNTLKDTEVNPALFEKCIKDSKFVDIIFACPDKKQITTKNNQQPATKQTLVIETNYQSLVKQHEKQFEQSKKETMSRNNADIRPDSHLNTDEALRDARNFKCAYPIKPFLFESAVKNVANLYKMYLAGFEINTEKYKNLAKPDFGHSSNKEYSFSWSITIVFNDTTLRVFCVHHEVQYNLDMLSPEINESFDDHDFGKELLFRDVDIIKLYEKENQEKIFDKLFDDEVERKKYFDPGQNKILERAHLAPLTAFTTPVIRQSAKTYGNVVPMWAIIRNRAWRRLENFINYLTEVFVNLTVISGTYGTLKLGGKEIFLADENKLPVPLAFWKLVSYGAGSDEFRGIFIVTINNPYEDIGNIICERDECLEYGWRYVMESNFTYGRTICCKFPTMILKEIPVLHKSIPESVFDLKNVSSFENSSEEIESLGPLLKKVDLDENSTQEEAGNSEREMMEEELEMNSLKNKKTV